MGIKEAWRALVGGEKKPRGLFYDYLGGWGGSSDDSTFGNSPRGWMQAVKSNVWAKNCVNARASAIAQVPLKLYKGVGEDKEEVLRHPALDLLNEVNPLNLNKSLLRKQTAQQRAIFGECFWLKVRPAPGQPPRELYVLAANDVEILPDANVWVRGYQWLPTGAVYGPDDVIRFYYPSFDGTPRAESPTATALNPINRYNLADVSQASIDARGGQGGGIVFYPDAVDGKTFDEMRHDWDAKRNNPKNAGRDMHVLGAVDYKAGAFAAREMQREERAARLAKEIMAAYQVPPAAAGDYSDASVLANAAIQSRMFWELWALDELGDIAETLNYDLLWLEYAGSRGQGLYFEHDLSGVAALRENDADKVNRAAVAFQSGLITANEARLEIGQKKVTGEDAALADKLIIAIEGQGSNERAKADAASPVYDSSRLSAKAGLGAGGEGLGVMVALMLPREAAASLLTQYMKVNNVGEVIEPPGELHITLAYLGNTGEYGDEAKQRVIDAVSACARTVAAPVRVNIKGAGYFVGNDVNAIWAGVGAEGLISLRNTLNGLVAQMAGINIPSEHGDYRPHVTLAYAPRSPVVYLPTIDPVAVSFGAITLAWGEERFEYALGDTDASIVVSAKANQLRMTNDELGIAHPRPLPVGGGLMPIVDFVGMEALDAEGNALGAIEAIKRFGEWDGLTATKAEPVVIVGGRAHRAGDVRVAVEVE